ncbi:hypothetical protein SprV_0802585400 [Sparganum proliferum]
MANLGLALLCFTVIATTNVKAEGYELSKEDTRIIDAESGCVELKTVVPADFTTLRLDATNYECTDTECDNVNNGPGPLTIEITKEHLDDAVRVTTEICDVERYAWLGFNLTHLMSQARQAFHTVHFSQAGKWTQVQTKCIQPQLGSPINMVKGERRITCAVKKDCAGSPLTIYHAEGELCRNYQPENCG